MTHISIIRDHLKTEAKSLVTAFDNLFKNTTVKTLNDCSAAAYKARTSLENLEYELQLRLKG